MSKTSTKRKVRYFNTPVSGSNYETFSIVGDEERNKARTEFLSGNYRKSFLDYTNAIKCYKEGLDRLGTDSNVKGKIRERIKREYLVMKAERRKAALYEATEETPSIFRGLLRMIKGRHILASFLVSILFFTPNLTGNVVGNGISSHWGGIGFFLLGVFLSYFFVFGRLLISQKNK